MINAVGLLLVCQLVGEVIARGLGLPIPGPVIGLVLLFLGLSLIDRSAGVSEETMEDSDLGRVAGGLLRSLGLFFVPAGAGVVQHLGLATRYGPRLALALVLSTLVTLVVTAWVFVGVSKLVRSERSGGAK